MSGYRFAVLGSPVEHSRSPELHRAMLELAALEGEYEKVEADSAVLAECISGLRSGEWDGLNVTMPLKTEAAKMSDMLSPRAARSESVNTLSLHDELVHGDSTDSTAFAELLADERFEDLDTILVLGSGGAAAAVLAATPEELGVYLTARRPARARQLTGRLGGQVVTWGTPVAGALVVNTTPLGMRGEPLPDALLEVASGLIDLPYAEQPTPALRRAAQLGLPHVDGHEFLLRQAIASFESWTGRRIDLEHLQTALGESSKDSPE